MASRAGRILTVRVSAPLERRLKARARREKTSESSLVRELLERGLAQDEKASATTAAERAGHLFGVIDAPRVPAGRDAETHLEAWKPDRRG